MGLFGLFLKIQLLTNIKKMKWGPFGDIKKLRKKTKKQNFEVSLLLENLQWGVSLGFLKRQFAAKYQNVGRQNIQKSRTVPKKIQRGTLLSHPVLYLTLKLE